MRYMYMQSNAAYITTTKAPLKGSNLKFVSELNNMVINLIEGQVRSGGGVWGGPPPHNGVRVVGFLKLYVEGELLFVSQLDNVVINLMVGQVRSGGGCGGALPPQRGPSCRVFKVICGKRIIVCFRVESRLKTLIVVNKQHYYTLYMHIQRIYNSSILAFLRPLSQGLQGSQKHNFWYDER